MAVRVTGIRTGTTTAENPHLGIVSFRWINEQTQQSGMTDLHAMYDWIVNKTGRAYINDKEGNPVYLFGATTSSGEKYIRAAKDQTWTNDLLEIQKF